MKKLAIVYLTATGLIYYREYNNQSLSLSFPKEIESDGEIKNVQSFAFLLENFIRQNKLTQENLTILISADLCFVHDFNTDNPKIMDEIQSFIDSTPFEHVGIISFKKDRLTTVVTTNKDLYEFIEEIFFKHTLLVSQIIPWSVLTTEGMENRTVFDQIVAQFIVNNSDRLKVFGFPFENKQATPLPMATPDNSQKKGNKRQYISVAIFVFLLAIMVIMLLLR